MDTIAEIKVVGDDGKKIKRAIQDAFKKMRYIESVMNFYDPNSETSKINKYAGKKYVEVSYEMCEILQEALKYSKLTDGAFDVTIGSLSKLWNFGSAKVPPPKEDIIDNTLLVNYRDLKLNINRREILLTREGMKIDLGGIAKGYAVEQAAKVLKDAGCKNFLINLGGNIKAVGTNPWGMPWKIGVRHPRQKGNILTVLKLHGNMAVATSGDYERYFIYEGHRYHHILDPKSGYPVSNGCISVTIITASAFIADILSTAVFVLGHKAGMDLIDELEGVEGIIVTDHETFLSAGIAGKIKVREL
jgi:thiamine biosynthesis lipoprotein